MWSDTRRRTLDAGRRKKARRLGRLASRVKRHAFPVVLSSPSGAGKTSIALGVVARDRNIVYSLSATTRPIRPGERNHQDYHFLTLVEFRAKQKSGYFIETARVYGSYYGTPKPFVLDALRRGYDVIADLDIQGARSVKRRIPGTVTVFVMPPSYRELRRRLVRRRTDSKDEISRRFACALEEWKAMPEFDYSVVNQNLKQAIAEVLMIINAERLRTNRRIDE